jgi:hypothetical protein
MRRVCAPPRTDPLTHQHDLDCDFACVLRKLSRDSQRSFSSLSFWHYFQVLVQNFLRLRRASVNFLSRLGPGSSPGRAESQLASELGELPLLGSQRVAVQQLPCPTAAATGHLVERSIARHVERRAALTVAALAAICSAFRRLVCRCTVHCWALCMDCARHTFACGCALCGGWC